MFRHVLVSLTTCFAYIGCSEDSSESQLAKLDGGDTQRDAEPDRGAQAECNDWRTVQLVGAEGLIEETSLNACIVSPEPDYERTTRFDRTGSSLCSSESASAPCGPAGSCHECTDNAQCGAGKACLCAIGIRTDAARNGRFISVRQASRCVESHCESSADCNGFACGYSSWGACDTVYNGFFCRSAADECASDSDCNSAWCIYDPSKGHWACSPPGGCT